MIHFHRGHANKSDTITIDQAIMMQEKLHTKLWIKTYHLEGKFILKINPEEEDKRNKFSYG